MIKVKMIFGLMLAKRHRVTFFWLPFWGILIEDGNRNHTYKCSKEGFSYQKEKERG